MIRYRVVMLSLLMGLLSITALVAQELPQYHIEGTAAGKDGQWVLLSTEKKQVVDSAQVVNGTFCFKGPLRQVQQMMLSLGKTKCLFLLNEHPIRVKYTVSKGEFRGKEQEYAMLKVEGDHDQQLLQVMNQTLAKEMFTMMAISLSGNKQELTNAQRDSIGVMYTEARNYTKQVFDSIVGHFPDSYISAIIINDRFAKERPLAELEAMYDQLSKRVKDAAPGKTLLATITSLKQVGVGSMAPDFSLPNVNNEEIKLSSLRGKRCVLIDFWASWCGPCIRELPNIKHVYDKYHDKGFEVISISLDDKRDNWLQAIATHQLPWIQVSSLQGWKCPVVQKYRVSAVPAMFLLDAEGRIVSNKARGEVLEREVEKLCEH